ncbi:hypothetical protein K432DRAFT_365083 [Lepidopterella palustris CBS 459.81]|uniref:Indole-diterpene biosynthesis protein PaxU n=1 Tax=Lepidopterella palustris CBS 459.81 TaxID=1314670 RepID=A0A8E2J8J5_9PEZI|nr:hypothetical protein K432DRAFT_365083 [Lepidopterella palustris CBS 459.81]
MAATDTETAPTSLKQFTHLSSTTSLFQPESFHPKAPTILVATWMNAADRNILFYIQKYNTLFPTARILFLRGIVSNMVYRSETSQKHDLQPIIHVLLAEPQSPVFAHLFSNSGAQQIGLLLRTYKEATGGQILPLRGMIFDSTPAMGTFQRAFDGIAYQIPTTYWWVRVPGLALLYVLVTAHWAFEKVTGRLNVVSQANSDLLDEGLIAKEVSRWYLYSNEDLLVRGDDVEWHAEMAERKGWRVEKEVFEGSGHCRHGKGEGEDRYWNVVETMMNEGRRDSKL